MSEAGVLFGVPYKNIYILYVLENKEIQELLCLNKHKPTQLLAEMKLSRVSMPFDFARKRNTSCTTNWSTDKNKKITYPDLLL